MKKLTMLSSQSGSPDGHHVQWYLVGRTYDVTESLAAIFLKEGWAHEADALQAPLPAIETPKAEIAPAHKQEYSAKKGRNR